MAANSPRIAPLPANASEPLLSPALMAQLERLDLVSRRSLRGRLLGERRGARKGPGVELADFRHYAPGDDLRFVDWNSYARLDRLFVRLFLQEEDRHFYILLDDSASMDFGQPTKFVCAQRLAAALGFVALARADRVRIESLGQARGRPAPEFRGRRSMWEMLAHLESLRPRGAVSLPAGARDFCLRNARRGIVLLLSDLLDKQGYAAAIGALVARQMDVYVIQVLAASELDPPYDGDFALVDCEDGEVAEISGRSLSVNRYRQAVQEFVAGASDYCTHRGAGHVLVDSRMPVEQFVGEFLRQRGWVRRW